MLMQLIRRRHQNCDFKHCATISIITAFPTQPTVDNDNHPMMKKPIPEHPLFRDDSGADGEARR
jgi:hypothetical protein